MRDFQYRHINIRITIVLLSLVPLLSTVILVLVRIFAFGFLILVEENMICFTKQNYFHFLLF